jgi:fructokinase
MILCCGESLIDMLPITGANGEKAFTPLSGGAIFNTAIALGRLEVSTGLLSGISTDLLGIQLVDELHNSKVATDLLIRSDRPTTLAFVELTNGHAEYTFYDENTAGRMIELSDISALPETISTVYFGGISLCGEPSASTYEALYLQEAPDRVTMIDPNIRPSFIVNETAYRSRLERMIAVADILKVSDEDLNWIIPKDVEQEAKVAALHLMGAKLVIVTKGSDGACAYALDQEPIHVSVPNVSVVDTVGAGDTFNAGFLTKLDHMNLLSKAKMASLNSHHIQKALGYATQVAALTVSRKGANPPFLKDMNA